MPLIRKVITLKTAKAICLPKSWLEYIERQIGAEIREVAIEVNEVLTVRPILPKEVSDRD